MTALSLEVAADCAKYAGNVLDATKQDGHYPEHHSLGRGYGMELVVTRPGQTAPGFTGFNGSNAFLLRGRSNTTFRYPFGAVMPGEANRRNQMLIVFRGSVKWFQDYIGIDTAMAPAMSSKGFMVHGGFNTVFKSCKPDLDAAMNSLWFDNTHMHTVHIAGHSMGGALATLCAEYLINSGYNVYLYTFGAPRVGMADHAHYMWNNLGTNIHRYYYPNDFITWLPILPYWHLPGIKLKPPFGDGFWARGTHGEYFTFRGQTIMHRATSLSGVVSNDIKEEVKALFAKNPPRYRCWTATRILLKALGAVLRFSVGGSLFIGVTVLDQVVHALTWMFNTNRKDNKSVVLSLTGYALKILGIPFFGAGKCIRSFLSYVFERFFKTVVTEADQEVDHFVRNAPRPVIRFE
jgi:hypothetical protein